MRLIFVENQLDSVGGVERVINVLSNRLSEKYEVLAVSKYKNTNKSFYDYSSKVKKMYLFDDFLKYRYIRNNSSIKKAVYYILRFFDKFRFHFTLYKNKNKLINSINNNDCIIFGRVEIACEYLPLLSRKKIHPHIIVRDAIHYEFFNNKVKRYIQKYFISNVDTMIVSSDESIKKYRELFGDKIKMMKLYNPIGINPIIKYKYDSKIITSIGRIDDMQKGFDLLIKSMKIVHEKYDDWKLKIYGDGKCKGYLEKLIDELDANDYISIEPYTKNVIDVFNNSSIFVLASRYEGYANILVEALSCGIPSISVDWMMGTNEIIKDGYNGIISRLSSKSNYMKGIYTPNDIESLANNIVSLISDKNLCDKFSKNSCEIIESRSQDKIIKRWEEIIEVNCNVD